MSREDPVIRIILDDGTHTNVSVYPIRGRDLGAVLQALHDASQGFRDGLVRDEESVERRLRQAVAAGIKK